MAHAGLRSCRRGARSLSLSHPHTLHTTHTIRTQTKKKRGRTDTKHTKGAEGGSAALAQRKDIEPGIQSQNFKSRRKNWDICYKEGK